MRRVIVAVAALVVAAGTARLGVWQLDRAAQKVALQQQIDARGALPPLGPQALARTPAEAEAQLRRRIELAGRWRPEFTVYLDNRQMHGQAGFYMVTPLQLDDGTAVLVQRGWLPRDPRDRTHLIDVPSAAGTVSLAGRIAASPARLYDFDAAAKGLIRQNLDVAAYARETGLALRPLSVEQLDAPAAAADGLQRDWPAPAVDVQKHYGYAFQWFAMAILTVGLYVWFQILRPWRQRRRARA